MPGPVEEDGCGTTGFRRKVTGRLLAWAICLLLAVSPAAAADSPPAKGEATALEILADGRLVGSASFVASYGLVLTAAHVVKGARRLEVLTPSFGRLRAVTVATDPGHDLALLRVERPGGFFPAIELAAADPPVGASVGLYGSVLFRRGLRIPGVVAGTSQQYEWNGVNRCYTEVLAVAAMTPDGLSGGAWLDSEGRLVGVQSGMIVKQGGLGGIAFMSPREAVRRLIEAPTSIRTATLGGQFAEPWEWSPPKEASGAIPAENGLYVLAADAGGPLRLAGVSPGERLVSIDGEVLAYRDQLLSRVAKASPGDKVTLTVEAVSGTRRKVIATLDGCGAY